MEAGNIGRHYHTWRYQQIGDAVEKQVIGPDGGTLYSKDGRLRIYVPAGALSSPTELYVQQATSVPGADASIFAAYQVGPSGTNFSAPVEVSYSYNPARLPSGANPDNLMLYRVTGETWHMLSDVTVDTEQRKVSGYLNEFSYIAVTTDVDNHPPHEDVEYWADMHLSWYWGHEGHEVGSGLNSETVWIDWAADLQYAGDYENSAAHERSITGAGQGYVSVKSEYVCNPPPPEHYVDIDYSRVATATFSFDVWVHESYDAPTGDTNLYLWFAAVGDPSTSYSQIGGHGCDGYQLEFDEMEFADNLEYFVNFLAEYPNELLQAPQDMHDYEHTPAIIAYAGVSGAKTVLTPSIHDDWMLNILLSDDGSVTWEIIVQDAQYLPIASLIH